MNTLRFFLAILILFLGLSLKTNAQWSDSTWVKNTDSTSIILYYPTSAFSSKDTLELDTTLFYFQRYDARTSDYDLAAGTMTIGGPIKNMYFSSLSPQFNIGEQNLGTYFYESENMPIYSHVRVPYSELFYTIAAQEENYLKGILANQASPRLYYGMNFNVESTIGLFANQRVSNAHFRGITSFETFNKRYGNQFEYIFNKFKLGENGGLANDYYYEDTTKLDRQILAVNLNEASNSVKSHQFVLKQHLNIGKAGTDSTKHKFIGKLYMNTLYTKRARMYTDNKWDSAYYEFMYLDSVQSADSSAFTNFKTDFGISNYYPDRHQYLTFDMGAAYNYKMYFDGQKESFFNYLTPHADVIFDFYKLILEGGFRYQIKIENQQSMNIGANDLNLYGTLKFPLLKYFIWDVGLKMDFQSPEARAYSTYSNHFMWNNDFDKQKHVELNSHFDFKGYQLEAAVHSLTDFVYYDQRVLPQQYGGSFQVITAKFNKRFAFKRLGSTMMVMYQKGSNDSIIRLPELVARGSFYFGFPMFNGALKIHPGFDLTYINSYQGDAYNPATMQFHLQNDKFLDNQFYVDLYVNFNIKRARIFIKYQNVASFLGNYNYFLVAHYPQQDAVLKFGISWKFFN